MKIKKDLPTILKLQRENNLDQEWLIDRIEEYIAKSKQSVAEEIYQEIEDSSFEVLFAKYLEHDDAVMAAEEIRKMVKSKYITEGKYK